jgi:hypothetical protein
MTSPEDLDRRIEEWKWRSQFVIDRANRRLDRMWAEAERAAVAGERARREIRRKLNIP